jgi:AcrR family transcriptional regulator
MRRASDEVRSLILDAAVREFATSGYAKTTTRGVATAAGVSLSTLHKWFPTKPELFSAALLGPFLEVLEEFGTAWVTESPNPWSDHETLRTLVTDLYQELSEHRATLISLLALAEGPEGISVLETVRAAVAAIRSRVGVVDAAKADSYGLDLQMSAHANRIAAGLVTGIVLLYPFFAPDEPDAAEDALTVDLIVRAVSRAIRT